MEHLPWVVVHGQWVWVLALVALVALAVAWAAWRRRGAPGRARRLVTAALAEAAAPKKQRPPRVATAFLGEGPVGGHVPGRTIEPLAPQQGLDGRHAVGEAMCPGATTANRSRGIREKVPSCSIPPVETRRLVVTGRPTW